MVIGLSGLLSLRLLEAQIVELEVVLLADSHAWASLPLVLVLVLVGLELLWWHLVVELRKHRWEIALHVLWVVWAMRW